MKTKSLILSGLLASSTLMADTSGSLFSYQFGLSSNAIHARGVNEPPADGFYNGLDLMASGPSGFGMGIGFDINVWHPEKSTGISGRYSAYTMGAMAKMGYTLQSQYNIPLKLKAGVGYGLMDVTVHDAWGLQYDASAEYLVYKNLGAGIKYKYAEADMLGTTIENETIVYYMMFGF